MICYSTPRTVERDMQASREQRNHPENLGSNMKPLEAEAMSQDRAARPARPDTAPRRRAQVPTQGQVVISFVVPGIPVPQGSKQPWGGEAHPHLRSWRAEIADQASKEMHDREVLWGPVEVQVKFVFPRPKKHYHQRKLDMGTLRDDAPLYHTNTPDLDKLQRAIGDALSKIVINDDSQIARWTTSKIYGVPRAEIRVLMLPTVVEI